MRLASHVGSGHKGEPVFKFKDIGGAGGGFLVPLLVTHCLNTKKGGTKRVLPHIFYHESVSASLNTA